MTQAPTGRRFRWSLRTMFVIMTVVGCWLGYELNWIRQRSEWRHRDNISCASVGPNGQFKFAPGFLRIFGEPGWFNVAVAFAPRTGDELTAKEKAELEEVGRIFPEAVVLPYFTTEPVTFPPAPH